MRPLEGVRVLDLASAIAGPYAAQLLADLGADVVKIEHPRTALAQRVILSPPTAGKEPFAPFFLACNRGKRSVTLDLSHGDGVNIFAELVRSADVVIENFGSRIRETSEVSEEWAWEINPQLIWGSITMNGRSGPDAHKNGLDVLGQARSGMLSVTGPMEGPPTRSGNSQGDYLAALHMAVGVLGALYQRTIDGLGQLVDISILESLVACLDGLPLWASISNQLPPRLGNLHPAGLPAYGVFELEAGYLTIAAGRSIEVFLCEILKRNDLFPPPRPESGLAQRHALQIAEAVTMWSAGKSRDEVTSLLAGAGVLSEWVKTVDEIWSDPHLGSRGMLTTDFYGPLGSYQGLGSPLHLSRCERSTSASVPTAGEHNEEILMGDLGYDGTEYARLVQSGALWGQ